MDENFQRLIAGASQEGFFAARECYYRNKAVNQKNIKNYLKGNNEDSIRNSNGKRHGV